MVFLPRNDLCVKIKLVDQIPQLLCLGLRGTHDLKVIRFLRITHRTGGKKRSPDKCPLAADILYQKSVDQSALCPTGRAGHL